ncbi:MAG TPA: Imm50 family immunity protein, partial [Lacipirellulaceae bacterium]|nr:Imm50 family immunity protein [Lacipirellulaceae bacterium]
LEYIAGAEQLTKVFGYWPSFHDAEVLWIKLDRRGPIVESAVHVFEITNEIDADGCYVLRNHLLVHLRFNKVVEVAVKDFNHQNALMGLRLLDLRSRQLEGIAWEVHFDPSWGLDATFQCASVEVVSVTPCDRCGNPIS